MQESISTRIDIEGAARRTGTRMSQLVASTPIEGPAAWTGAALAQTDEWIYSLSAAETLAVEGLVAALRRTGKRRDGIARDDVQLGTLAPAVRAWRETL